MTLLEIFEKQMISLQLVFVFQIYSLRMALVYAVRVFISRGCVSILCKPFQFLDQWRNLEPGIIKVGISLFGTELHSLAVNEAEIEPSPMWISWLHIERNILQRRRLNSHLEAAPGRWLSWDKT